MPIQHDDDDDNVVDLPLQNQIVLWKGFGFVLTAGVLLLFCFAIILPNASDSKTTLHSNKQQNKNNAGGTSRRRLESGQERIKVFSVQEDHPIARKQRNDIAALADALDHVVLNLDQQRDFLVSSSSSSSNSAKNDCGGEAIVTRFDDLVRSGHSHLATEVWKYCALYLHGGVYLDSSSPLLVSLDSLIFDTRKVNKAVINDVSFPNSLHGSFLYLQKSRTAITKGMLHVLLETPITTLQMLPLVLPQTLYTLIQSELPKDTASVIHSGTITNLNSNDWHFFEQKCFVDPVRTIMPYENSKAITPKSFESRPHYNCPAESGFCCHIFDTTVPTVVMMTSHPLLPYQLLPSLDQLVKPYASQNGHFQLEDLPYISTIRERVLPRPNPFPSTPNFFEILLQNDCLPADQKCASCLRNKGRGATCQTCLELCPCYCKTLCQVSVPSKWVAKEITVTPPTYSRDPSRLVPRIVHQTWFEPVQKEKYPNMSRLIESFRQSGWEYRFYTDDVAANFLSTHFPPEVREAYDALRPGAFKADLFRYCVLLIHGGVYADMDVMLESNLDVAVGPDVGFLVPVDEPGKPIDLRMCLWNGLIAAAPGHPFLAKVVESVVNNVRNRFTSVDYDNMFCPNPELSVLHAFDTLFTAGPCILGSTVNQMLGRIGQTQFEPGELFPVKDSAAKLPGRTIILHQNKWDMGAHRFTLLEKNLVVAGTDFPEYDDRANEGVEHYSKTHVNTGIYGVDRLYADNKLANEELRFYVGTAGDLQTS